VLRNPTRHAFRALRLLFVIGLTLLAAALWAAPRNVILMVGDGMGSDIVAAAGAYQYGARYHTFGGDQRLVLETLTGRYYTTTHSTNGAGYDFTWEDGSPEYPKKNATDSAAAATALATGVKTYNGAINMDDQRRPLVAITALARQSGLKIGVVASVRFYDATPACFAAHNVNRGNATAITHEMLMVTQPDVLMGAGDPDSAPADHDTGYLNQVQPTAAGQLPTVAWGTDGGWGGHTNRLVPLYCQGKGSEAFANYAFRVRDFEHGLVSVVDNTAVFQVMKRALPVESLVVAN